MEEDDEIQSPSSPVSPRSNGRITVTVAAPAPLPPPQQNTLTLALPVQQPRNNGGGGGREDCWSEGATEVLINAWGERYLELSRGNLKQKHWKEVADIVSSREDYTKTPKTDIQCKNRIDTVKKKYKLEKTKIVAGGGPSKWPFFERLDHLIGPSAKIASSAGTSNRLPLGIPVGVNHQQLKSQKRHLRRRPPVDSDSSASEKEPSVSSDSFPPVTYQRKKPRLQREINSNAERKGAVKGREVGRDKDKGGWGSAVRELTQAILKFGEAYEQAENSKLQQVVEMEKQRMKFFKELELQRMQFFMKTQLEISQLKQGRRGENASNNVIINNNNNSDSNN